MIMVMIITRLNRHDEVQDLVDDLFNDDQEEIVHEPKIIQQHVEMVVDSPVPMIQEEIVHVPAFIHRVSRILSFSPKTQDLYRKVCNQTLPSERHDWIL